MRVTHIIGSRTLARTVAVLAAVSGAAAATSTFSAPAASAEDITMSEITYCTLSAFDCIQAEDARKWAIGVSQWRYRNEDPAEFHGGTADAYRHCIWSGAIAQRIGEEKATTLLAVHELEASDGPDHVQMDMENNRTGAAIGALSNSKGGSDTWGWIMQQCGKKADAGSLTTIR